MAVVAGKFVIGAGASATGKAMSFASQITTAMTSVNYKILAQGPDHDGTAIWNQTYRMSPWDQHDSKACVVMINNSAGQIHFRALYDANIQTLPGQVIAGTSHWGGLWTTAGFPDTSGVPSIATVGTGSTGTTSFTFDGASSYTVRYIISEFGIWTYADNGALKFVMVIGRPLGNTHPGRNLFIQATEHTAPPYEITAPSGTPGVHLKLQADAREIPITFATGFGPGGGGGSGYLTGELAQAITMQSGGLVRGVRRDIAISPPNRTEALRIVMEPDRAPSAGIPGADSQLTPMLRLSYQDPTLPAMGLDFACKTGITGVTVASPATPRGEFTLAAAAFITNGVRLGSLVYNHTRNSSAEVVAFGLGGSESEVDEDTLYLDTIPPAWDGADSYDVYPYTDQQLGSTSIGGSFQCCLESDEVIAIEKSGGGDVDVVLNDVYGEAQGLFSVGQGVQINSNSLAVTIALSSSAGYLIGQLVEDSLTGTRGIIRGNNVAKNTVVVDTISNGAPTAAAWTTGGGATLNNVTTGNPRQGGATGVSFTTVLNASTFPTVLGTGPQGWSTYVLVTGVAQKGGDDLRTVLSLALDTNQNAALNLMPGSCIGVRAKTQIREAVTLPAGNFLSAAFLWPSYGTTTQGNDYQSMDIRRNEVLAYGSLEPPHAPDYETGSFDVSPLYLRPNNAIQGYATVGTYAHMKGLSAAGSIVQIGDEMHEDGDSERRWFVGDVESNEFKGATTQSPNVSQHIILGPGGANLI